jgi:hypothetical protein
MSGDLDLGGRVMEAYDCIVPAVGAILRVLVIAFTRERGGSKSNVRQEFRGHKVEGR